MSQFQLFDVTNTTLEAILDVVLSANYSESLLGQHTLTLQISPFDRNGNRVISYIGGPTGTLQIHEEKYIRAITGAITRNYIIKGIEIGHDVTGKVVYTLSCEHIRYTGIDLIIPRVIEYTSISATDLLADCASYWTLKGFALVANDIPTTVLRDLKLEMPNLVELLNLICKTYSGSTTYYWQINDGGDISILSETNIGATEDFAVVFKPGTGITRSSDSHNLVNRLYAYAEDGNHLGLAGGTRYIDANPDVELYMAGDSIVHELNGYPGTVNNNPVKVGSILSMGISSQVFISPSCYYNFDYSIRMLNAAGATIWGPCQFRSSDVGPSSSWINKIDWLNIDIGDLGTVKKIHLRLDAVNKYGTGPDAFMVFIQFWNIYYTLSSNTTNPIYIEDATSKLLYGEKDGRVKSEHLKVQNLISPHWLLTSSATLIAFDATMSGIYSGATNNRLHYGWGKLNPLGSYPFCDENTDRTYIKNGSKSQRVYCNLKGQGIYTNRAIYGSVKDKFYFATFNIYVAYGQIKIEIKQWGATGTLLFSHITSGTGMLEIKNETPFSLMLGSGSESANGFQNHPLYIYITSESTLTYFYLDSLQIAEGMNPVALYNNNSADIMLLEAQRVLARSHDPRISYDIDLSDFQIEGLDPRDESFEVGDKVKVIDGELNLNEYLRVIKIDRDLLRPEKVRLQLSNKTQNLSEVVALISGNKQMSIEG